MLKIVVLSCMVAATAAAALSLAPFAPLAYTPPLSYSAPLASLLTPYGSNYRGPLSLAPGQPANILAADGRPLDTLDVNLDRSAHYTAKGLSGSIHYLKKRAIPMAELRRRLGDLFPIHSDPYSAPVPGSRLPVEPISYSGAPVLQTGTN